jgi:hypothetical protein
VIVLCGALALRHLGDFRAPADDEEDRSPIDAPPDGERYAELWILCIVGTVAALIAAAEIVYLRDIFNSRMNTVFKLYFQSWLLLGIAAGPALAWLLPAMRRQLAALAASLAAPRERSSVAPAAGMFALAGLGRTSVHWMPLHLSGRHALAANKAHSRRHTTTPAHAAKSATGSAPDPANAAESATPTPTVVTSRDEGARSVDGAVEAGVRLPGDGGAGFPLALRWLRAGGILIWMSALVVLVGAALVYPMLAASSRTANFSLPRTLDGTAYMATDPASAGVGCGTVAGTGTNVDDNEAIAWLNTRITGSPVIVEAPGCEWSHYSRISSFTGLPTLIGWPGGHEGEWRANWLSSVSPNDPFGGRYFGQRIDAVNRIYTDPSDSHVISLLKQYGVRLVYVGAAERQLYATANLSRFGTFLRVIYARDGITIYQVP